MQRAAAVRHSLTLRRPRSSRHRDVQGGTTRATVLGAAIGLMSGRDVAGTAVRQLAVAAVAAAVTYGVGSLLGVSAT